MSVSEEESALSLTEEVLAELDKLLENYDPQIVGISLDMFRYVGFDPSLTRRLLSETANFNGKEIRKLCWVYTVKGTNTERILRTSTGRGKVDLETLFEKYNVKPRLGKGDMNTITLSRIAASFPDIVCKFCLNSKVRVIPVSPDKLPLSYPKAMTTQVFASVMPTSDESLATMMLNAHLLYLIKFDAIINKKPSSLDVVVKYQKLAYQSTILTEEEKIKCCLWLKVLCKDDRGRLKLMPEVALAAFQIVDPRRRPAIPTGYFLSDWHDSFLGMGLSLSFLEELYEGYGYSLDDIKKAKDKENSGMKDPGHPVSVDASAKSLGATESFPTSEDGKGSEAASSTEQDQGEEGKGCEKQAEEEEKEEKDDDGPEVRKSQHEHSKRKER